jgi:probable H4MPT-linked C1 transfer pathway protein
MTGELCDCFESRQSGVRSIVASVVEAFPDNPICFYQVDGGFVDREGAVKNWQKTAAANWHAIASMIGRRAPQLDGLFIDMGSTTTDLIPIVKGQVHSQGSNDFERLVHQELIYTGLGRTPVNTLVTEIMIGDARTRIAAECFATMLDAHVIAGTIPANDQNLNTCDGRSLTRDNSLRRLARMLCTEPDVVGIDRLEKWAEEIIGKQMEIISKAASKQLGLLSKDAVVWISGEGSQVLAELLKPFAERHSVLPVWEDPPSSNAAAAVALWHLLETDFER